MTEAPNLTWQKDQSLRGVISLEAKRSDREQWQHRLASLHDRINFRLAGATETSQSHTILYATDYFRAVNKRLIVRGNLTAQLQRAKAEGYSDSTRWFHQKRLAVVGMAEYHWPRLLVQAQIRQEWAAQQGAPFTWSLGGRWDFQNRLSAQLHISRNFNLPTFNDRFWRNLGNPDLRPESGYSTEMGLRWKGQNGIVETTVFQLLLDDWILWQPGSDGLFRPNNLRQVWSRGLTVSSHWNFTFWQSQWTIKGRYQFVRATNTAVYDNNGTALGKVLPYTPAHATSASVHWTKGAWSVSYLQQWTGSRFTTSDNAARIAGFQTGNVFVQFRLPFSQQELLLHARLENCWNTAYQILAYRPMPGRNGQVGLVWKI
jgi:iron complex outermembrane receptor protein